MTDDIVARLRLWSDNAKEQDATEIVVGLREAADEIERLRNDLDGSQLAYRGASYDRDRMRAERDEARREVCELDAEMYSIYRGKPRPVVNIASCMPWDIAIERGWDCFKEER